MADMAGRILALDVGDVRIGVAVSDPTGTIAQPLEVYRRVGYGPDSRYVAALCQRMDCESVLLGLPLNMDGSTGPQAQKVMDFGAVLEKAGLTVHYQDERLTTVRPRQCSSAPVCAVRTEGATWISWPPRSYWNNGWPRRAGGKRNNHAGERQPGSASG